MNLFFSITCDKVNCRFLNGSKIGLFYIRKIFLSGDSWLFTTKNTTVQQQNALRILVNNFSYLEWSSTFSFRVGKKHQSTNKQNKESCDFDLSTENPQKISDWHQSILTCHSGLKSFTNEHSYFYISYYLVHKVQSFLKQWMHYLQ